MKTWVGGKKSVTPEIETLSSSSQGGGKSGQELIVKGEPKTRNEALRCHSGGGGHSLR